MAGLAVFGSQWGDEGKGRFVDLLAEQADYVIRYQGGNNAGHTVYANGVEYKLRTIPSGVISNKICLIGNGVVVDPADLIDELEYLKNKGLTVKNLYISDRAHVIMPYHRELDRLKEAKLGDAKIGTTCKGIGPCYTDKAARCGIRFCDLMEPDTFAGKLKKLLADKNEEIVKLYGGEPLDYDTILNEYTEYAKILAPMVTDTAVMADKALKDGKKLMFEGAQGMLLDIDLGTYPYVTSSHPSAAGISAGIGLGPQCVSKVLAIVKAYTTRVGEGPFVTELLDDIGSAIREKGHEYGVRTGRARRCGWLDLVVLKHAIRSSGITDFALSRMDTLGGFDKVKICTGYECDGQIIDYYPASLSKLAKMKPVYTEFEGWSDDLSAMRSFDELPEPAKKYVRFIEEQTGVPVSMIGVGPEREQCIVRNQMF